MTLSRLQGTTSVLKTATGETANVLGKIWLGIKIGGTEVSHETLVAEISDKFILGLDFLMAHGCTVDAGGGSLRIGVEEVPLHKPSARQLARCYRLTAVEDTLISPYSETPVAARIMDDPLGEPWGTVGPSLTAKLPPDVMVRKTLFDAQQDCVPVRVVSLSGQPRKKCQGTEVASCEPVESVIHQQHDSTPDSQSVGDDLPEHLKDLYTRSPEGLNAGQKLSCTSSCLNSKTSSQKDLKISARLAYQNMRSTPVMLFLFASTQGDYLWHSARKPLKQSRTCINKA